MDEKLFNNNENDELLVGTVEDGSEGGSGAVKAIIGIGMGLGAVVVGYKYAKKTGLIKSKKERLEAKKEKIERKLEAINNQVIVKEIDDDYEDDFEEV